MGRILVTSGYSFEGFHIVDYLGVYTGECALGTGFLSTLGASFADFFGTNSVMYSDKLKKAKDFAIEQLEKQVCISGGNAIVGLDIDYVAFSADIMGVIASGTAVKLAENALNKELLCKKKISISTTNIQPDFIPLSIIVENLSDKFCNISLEIVSCKEPIVSAILAEIKFVDIFERNTVFSDIVFKNFEKIDSKKFLVSESVPCQIPKDIFQLQTSVQVKIEKYIMNNKLIDLSKKEIEYTSPTNQWLNSAESTENTILNATAKLSSAIEIYNYLVEFNELHNFCLKSELLDKIQELVNVERYYGNCKESCIKKIEEYFSQNV